MWWKSPKVRKLIQKNYRKIKDLEFWLNIGQDMAGSIRIWPRLLRTRFFKERGRSIFLVPSHFKWVTIFNRGYPTYWLTRLNFNFPVVRKIIIRKFLKVLKPLAFALAAWTMELRPSRIPLFIRDRFHSRIPSQWDLIVFAAFIIGSRRLWVAQKYHLLSNRENASSVSAW